MPAVVTGPEAQLISAGAYVYSYEGTLRMVPGQTRLYMEQDSTLVKVRASVNSVAGGQSILIGVNRNGALLLTVEIPAGEPTVVIEPGTVLAEDDYLTVDILQVGLGLNPGSGLTVQVQINAYEGE